jgi:hypothetical protein
MGRIEATGLAYERSVFATDPASPRRCADFGHSISDRSVPVVRKPDSSRLQTASTALGGAGGTRGYQDVCLETHRKT